MNIIDLYNKKQKSEKITMVTCYDYWSAQIISETDIDCILVGDSAGMVMQGFKDTIPVTVDDMIFYTKSVARGATNKFIITDMPFMSYRKGLKGAVENVTKLIQAGANAVKVEGADGNDKIIQHVVQSGVPVIGHIGLTPQSVHYLGGFKVQGKSEKSANNLINQAKKLQECGVSMLVLECIPDTLAKKITTELHIPTIGIGAGKDVDGQVLVLHDLLGLTSGYTPKFVKKYINGKQLVLNALGDYSESVKTSCFPAKEHTY